jgi:hypothetical protein
VSYTIETVPHGALISLASASREEVVRDLVASLLEAAYGAGPAGAAASGQMVPIQAAGADDRELLSNLAADTLHAIAGTDGTLLPPRWLAFDEKRVTAILPVVPTKGEARPLSLGKPLTLDPAAPGFVARLSLESPKAR